MSQTPLIFPLSSLDEIKDFELPKTPIMTFTPVIHPEDSFGIPSPLNLSSKKFSLYKIEHPLSDDEIIPKKANKLLSFKYVDNKKLYSNKNYKSKVNKEKEENCFNFKKNFNNDFYDNYFIEANDSEESDKEKDKESENDADNEGDEEKDLKILKVLKRKSGVKY
jgi:hypothetical protein